MHQEEEDHIQTWLHNIETAYLVVFGYILFPYLPLHIIEYNLHVSIGLADIPQMALVCEVVKHPMQKPQLS